MPEREKIVLTLYYYEGLTLAEIGQVLGVTESRVCQIHTKAVLHLRARLSAGDRDACLIRSPLPTPCHSLPLRMTFAMGEARAQSACSSLSCSSRCSPRRRCPPRADDATSTLDYRPPVDAPIIDHFRPPPAKWAAGNRGIDYGTVPGTPVHAAEQGLVEFAGQVGGTLHVVVRHPDGLRTSYSFLASIAVVEGQQVSRGSIVGTADTSLHFGVRSGDTYIDPELVLAARRSACTSSRPRARPRRSVGWER